MGRGGSRTFSRRACPTIVPTSSAVKPCVSHGRAAAANPAWLIVALSEALLEARGEDSGEEVPEQPGAPVGVVHQQAPVRKAGSCMRAEIVASATGAFA